ncbi:MAG: hypothetical protein AAB572_01170, partial [Patescibacteria group bacterium]
MNLLLISQRCAPSCFFFIGEPAHPPRKALTVRALNAQAPEGSRETVAARYNPSGCDYTKKIAPEKALKKLRTKD